MQTMNWITLQVVQVQYSLDMIEPIYSSRYFLDNLRLKCVVQYLLYDNNNSLA